MVTIQSAENALKTLYLGVVSNQLNTNVNPLLAKIQQTSSDVWGKEIVKLAPYGLNGGVGAGTETGDLPLSGGNNYAQFKLTLKNIYGTIELSDKAIRASESSEGAFVNLLNAEMEGLLRACKFNFGRMLYGDGSGKIANCVTDADNTDTNIVKVASVKNLMEGMIVDFYNSSDAPITNMSGRRILSIDRANKKVKIDGTSNTLTTTGDYITLQGSKGLELTGLGAIFSNSETLYGLNRAENHWLQPYMKNNVTFSLNMMQEAIDYVEENTGSQIDFILCSSDVKRMYLDELNSTRRNVDFMNLDGGYKALSYNGIPVVSDRFIEDGTMYMLNSKDFKLHQLCDWRWLEGEGGRVLKQTAGKPTYNATIVKYADLICDKPAGQVKISGITAAN